MCRLTCAFSGKMPHGGTRGRRLDEIPKLPSHRRSYPARWHPVKAQVGALDEYRWTLQVAVDRSSRWSWISRSSRVETDYALIRCLSSDETDFLSRLVPNLDGFDPEEARRIFMTVSCSDSDEITKVNGAGGTRDENGQRVQMMHNGLVVKEGGYFGGWMTEIIRTLRGHHEPQEELVFDRIIKRLQMDGTSPVMIELGSFWTYYGLWFCQALRSARVVALEPDPAYLEVGRRNAELNGFTDQVTFFHAAVGNVPGQKLEFCATSDGREYEVEQHDLASLMKRQRWSERIWSSPMSRVQSRFYSPGLGETSRRGGCAS